MKYGIQNQNGNAAEYFAAYKFTSLFRWPFRLYGVDLGIDGEFEIQDSQGTSTGNIVKVQIKSITGQERNDKQVHVRPSARHIEYWKTFCTPVIIVGVDLKREQVYWTQISETNAYSAKKGTSSILLHRTDDLLVKDSESSLRELATPVNAHALRSVLGKLTSVLGEFLDGAGNIIMPVGNESGRDFMNGVANISELVSKARELEKYFPWKLSQDDRALLEKATYLKGIIRRHGQMAINGDFS